MFEVHTEFSKALRKNEVCLPLAFGRAALVVFRVTAVHVLVLVQHGS